LAGLFVAQFGSGELAELVIYKGKELLGGRGVARLDVAKDASNVAHAGLA